MTRKKAGARRAKGTRGSAVRRAASPTPRAQSKRRGAGGRQYEVDLDRVAANHMPLTPLAFFERAAAVYATKTAVVHGDRTFTYAEFYARRRRLASVLVRRGVRPGDTVAAMAPNVLCQAGRRRQCLRTGLMSSTILLADVRIITFCTASTSRTSEQNFHALRSGAERQAFELSRGQQIFRKGLKRDFESPAELTLGDHESRVKSRARNHVQADRPRAGRRSRANCIPSSPVSVSIV